MLKLWKHQENMCRAAMTQRGTLWHADMGTGKTRAAIETWERLARPKTLIVAPLSVVRGVWPDQFDLWANDPKPRITVVDGSVKSRRGKTAAQNRIQLARDGEIVVVNYDMIWRKPFSEALLKMGFELLILDESHRIKAPGGVTSRYISRLSDRINRRIALTGTPMPHSPMDIYAQYRALDKRIFGTSNATFKSRYAVLGGFSGKEVVGYQNEAELRQRFDSIAVRIKREDVLTLPDSTDATVYFDLAPRASKLYSEAEREFFIEVAEKRLTIANALVRLLRLQTITSGHIRLDDDDEPTNIDDGKQSALKDVLTDAGESHVVVFARFTKDIENIKTAASQVGLNGFEFSGALKQIDEWRDTGGVLATQIQSGGLGIDLTAARLGVYYSLGFSLGEYLQSRARILRPGQKRKVAYIHIAARGTVDERVINSLQLKQDVIKFIMEGADVERKH